MIWMISRIFESPDIDDELTDSLLSSIEDEEDNFNEENTDI